MDTDEVKFKYESRQQVQIQLKVESKFYFSVERLNFLDRQTFFIAFGVLTDFMLLIQSVALFTRFTDFQLVMFT